MKLVHADLSCKLFDENIATEWIIESPEYFLKFVSELYHQCQGEEGKFVLSEKDKELEISKTTEFINDLLSLDMNNRKLANKVFADLVQLSSSEDFFVQTQELVQRLQEYVFRLEEQTDFILDVQEQVDMVAIFKGMGVKLHDIEENMCEKIVCYIKAAAGLLRKTVFVFVNLRSYLNDTQMEQLLAEMRYQEVHILMIENHAKDCMEGVRRCIIDIDGCEI